MTPTSTFAAALALTLGFVAASAGMTLTSNVATAEVIGFTEPVQTIDLAASETGTLAELYFERGQRVSPGDVIASLDCGVLRARLDVAKAKLQSRANIRSAAIRVHRAQRHAEQLRQLHIEGHGGQREVEVAESELQIAKTELEAAEDGSRIDELEVKRIESEIRRRTLISPIEGVISVLNRDVGEFVSGSQPEVCTIVNLRQLRVRFHPPMREAIAIRPGQSVRVKIMCDDLPVDSSIDATVEYISPTIDPDSNTIQIDVLIENESAGVRSGLRCSLEAGPDAQTAARGGGDRQ